MVLLVSVSFSTDANKNSYALMQSKLLLVLLETET